MPVCYDAWGKVVSVLNEYGTAQTTATFIGNVNPIRYRGYYYDTETKLYYLQSRYYDPETCRFVNMDGIISTGQGILEHNMYAYCYDNPINLYDPTGKFPWLVVGIVAGVVAAASVITSAVTQEENYNYNMIAQVQLPSGFITDQRNVDYLRMGFFGASWNGCGWIAVYNAMIMLGKPQQAADVIKYFDGAGQTILFGTFGVTPNAITEYLISHRCSGKISAIPFYMPSDIEAVAQRATACIMLYAYSGGAHYVAFQWNGSSYDVYNDNIKSFTSVNDYMDRVGGTFVTIWCMN